MASEQQKQRALAEASAAASALQVALEPAGAAAPFTPAPDPFFITTAIAYTNGAPHMGHSYEIIVTDVLARYHRRYGRKVFFLTGTDEHGQKISDKAAELGKQPIEQCDYYAGIFKDLYGKLNISNDRFIRTTEADHIKTSQWIWTTCKEDIYLDQYKGWYNVKEETYVTETEAQATDYKDPSTGKPLEKREEASYFFKMSKYQDQLVQHIETHPEFIQPADRRKEILERLKEPLRDLSVSRTTFKWGIPVPDDEDHVMYVWFDALTNYLSGIDYATNPGGPNAKLWPPAAQVIGKDITWFHTVIWPCMLLSAKLPLPKTVYAHGFVLDEIGRKMSKTTGNVVDPFETLQTFPSDTFRYFLVRECTFGSDLPFSAKSVAATHNNVLADVLGNLVHRGVNLCKKYCDGAVPDVATDAPFDLDQLRSDSERFYATYDLRAAAEAAIDCVSKTNKYLTDKAPWKSKDPVARQVAVRSTLEALYVCAHFLEPLMPTTCGTIFQHFNTPARAIPELNGFNNLAAGTPVTVGDILFRKIEYSETPSSESPAEQPQLTPEEVAALTEEIAAQGNLVRQLKSNPSAGDEVKAAVDKLLQLKAKLAAGAPAAAASLNKASKGKKPSSKPSEKAKAQPAQSQAAKPPPAENLDTSPFGSVEVRVGQIVEAWPHPDSEKLWCEKIDLGEGEPRQILSGLREYYTLEQMQGARVLVVCNLKPAKLGGLLSSGMVLCAKSEEGTVEFVAPPAEAKPGDRVTLAGFEPDEPATATQMKKKKLWEAVAKDLRTNGDRAACFNGTPLEVVGKQCIAPTVANGVVS